MQFLTESLQTCFTVAIMKEGLQLDHIVLLGRSLAEYSHFFHLESIHQDRDRILDMGAGVSSCCAELSGRGHHVTAADPIYDLPPDIIESKCRSDLDDVVTQLPESVNNYRWVFYRDIADLRRHREQAYRGFLRHVRGAPTHYVTTELPQTSFHDNEFTVSLVSHLLFMYDDRLDYDFHKQSILELSRITTREIQIYPLTNLKAQKSLLVDQLMQDRDLSGLEIAVESIDFEFLKNSNERLMIRKGR